MKISRFTTPFYYLTLFFLLTGFLLRLVLIFHPITQSSFGFSELIKIFFLGTVSDFFVFIIASFFLWIYLLFISNEKYLNPTGPIIFSVLLTLLVYISFFNTILDEYGSVVPKISIIFLGIKTTLFGLFLFLPKYRNKIRFYLFAFVIFIYVILILQNIISEYLFWNEFGVRYNFIAVNYLIYTNEVIGNIMESYPVVSVFSILFLIAGTVTFFIAKKSKNFIKNIPSINQKIKYSVVYLALFGLSFFAIPMLAEKENSKNIFSNEMQANGLYKFYIAFMNSHLDYFKFYKTLPPAEAYALLKNQIPELSGENILRDIKGKGEELHKNVVLITVESLSASFMKTYGNDQNITPFLDELFSKSLVFSNFYATGNRTVRGLEAVTLCIPPTAGESIVKRIDNKDKFTTGFVFAEKGYNVNYYYGGDSFFDNMKDFFEGNSYKIIDKNSFRPEEISFKNIWGVCDEDMYRKFIATTNEQSKDGKPFFSHIMSVSNHRPFTYPDNKIDIPSNSKSREGGVKYTDYALKKFFEMASQQKWFNNTVFVIVADHCASSAGKTELPLDKYRIPALIYSPGFIAPNQYHQLMSQIDIMPTLLGLLNFNYQSKFFGQDVFAEDYKPRAFVATYQDLGLIRDNVLTVISPKQKIKQFDLILKPNQKEAREYQIYYESVLLSEEKTPLVNETISFYQTASDILKKKKYEKK